MHELGKTVAMIAVMIAALSTTASENPDPGKAKVILETSLGEIEVEVDVDRAPLSAGDFLRYVDEGLYEGAAFYRVVRKDNDHGKPKIEVVQGGLPENSERLPPIILETTEETGITHEDGVISLARGEPNSGGGAAFFICIGRQPSLDLGGNRNPDGLGFAAFGQVTRGMDVVRKIHGMQADAPTSNEYLKGQLLSEPVTILSARRVGEVD